MNSTRQQTAYSELGVLFHEINVNGIVGHKELKILLTYGAGASLEDIQTAIHTLETKKLKLNKQGFNIPLSYVIMSLARRNNICEYAEILRKRGIQNAELIVCDKKTRRRGYRIGHTDEVLCAVEDLISSNYDTKLQKKKTKSIVQNNTTLSMKQRHLIVADCRKRPSGERDVLCFSFDKASNTAVPYIVLTSDLCAILESSSSQTLLLNKKGLHNLGAPSIFTEIKKSYGANPQKIVEYFISLNEQSHSNHHEFNHIASYWRCGVTQVSCLDNHLLLVAKGKVYAWGKQCGFDDSSVEKEELLKIMLQDAHVLREEMFLSCPNFQKLKELLILECGHFCDHTEKEEVPENYEKSKSLWHKTMLYMGPRKIPGLCNIIKVSCGADFALALDSQGNVLSWGSDKLGNLGLGLDTAKCVSVPTKLTNLPEPVQFISCGANHSLALTISGHVYSWGSNTYGQLGQPHYMDTSIPLLIESVKTHCFVKSACGDNHSIIVSYSGAIFTFGNNWYGQLGRTAKSRCCLPTIPPTLETCKINLVSASGNISIASTANGLLFHWGKNCSGEFGILDYSVPQKLSIPMSIKPGQVRQKIYDIAISRGCITICIAS